MPALSKRKQQLKKLAANKKKQKEDDEPGSAAAAAPSAARGSPAKRAVLGRPPKRKDANPRVRRGADQITCAEAALFSQAISQEIESGRKEKAAARARADPAGQREAEQRGSLLTFVCCSQKA